MYRLFFCIFATMKVLFLTQVLEFSVIPRSYPLITDLLTLSMRNEHTNTLIEPDVSFTITDKLNITITTQPEDFKSQNRYEITIKNGDNLIYLGQSIVLDANTDVQNYEYSTQTNEKYGYK